MGNDTRVLVLDFDGTVCIGDDPVLAYGHELHKRICADGQQTEIDLVHRLTNFLADTDRSANKNQQQDALRDAADGYAAAYTLARMAGLDSLAIQEAYAASRQRLASGQLDTFAPPGLSTFLTCLPPDAVSVLVTNAPSAGINEQLTRLGIAHQLDRIITDANKPQGMTAILRDLLTHYDIAGTPKQLLSVGDIWRNDLQPAYELGCITALIDRHGTGIGSPHLRAQRFEQLYSEILVWAGSVSNCSPSEAAQ